MLKLTVPQLKKLSQIEVNEIVFLKVWEAKRFKALKVHQDGVKHIKFLRVAKRKRERVMPRSHQTFRSVSTVKLLGIMFRIRCWPTTFQPFITRDADGWCQNWPV